MRIKPTKIRVYVEYECSKCGYFYGDYRLSEVGRIKSFKCPDCGQIDKIEPLIVDVGYKTGEHTSVQVTCNLSSDDVKNTKAVLRSMGYTGNQSALVVKRTLFLHPGLKTYDELVKKALVEAANVYANS